MVSDLSIIVKFLITSCEHERRHENCTWNRESLFCTEDHWTCTDVNPRAVCLTSTGTGIEVATGGEDVIGTTEDDVDTTDGVTVMEGVGLTAGIVLVVARGSVYT